MNNIPCLDEPEYEIKVCEVCQQRLVKEVHQTIEGMKELHKTVANSPHHPDCASLRPCDCFKTKIDEIYNG